MTVATPVGPVSGSTSPAPEPPRTASKSKSTNTAPASSTKQGGSFPAQYLVYSFNTRAQVPFKSAVGRFVVLRSHEFVGKVLLWRDSVGIVVGVFVFDSVA